MDAKKKLTELERKQKSLRAFLREYPQMVDELLRFCEPEEREAALRDVSELSLATLVRLEDRATYICKTRIVKRDALAPRYCDGKVMYDERGARAKVNSIWDLGRGKMRVYQCPKCGMHHLTHTEKRAA